jgi:hypothetical protein
MDKSAIAVGSNTLKFHLPRVTFSERSCCAFAAKGRKLRRRNFMLLILPSQAIMASQFQIPESAATSAAYLITRWATTWWLNVCSRRRRETLTLKG